MFDSTAILFTSFGLGQGPAELQQTLAGRFLALLGEADVLPRRLLFYTEGVRLVCEGSPVLEQLEAFETRGVELIICSTCLDYYGLSEKVRVGIVGGMPDIIQALAYAQKVISV